MMLDEHVPLVTKTITTHYINPWFDEKLREQKRIVQSRERMEEIQVNTNLAGLQERKIQILLYG